MTTTTLQQLLKDKKPEILELAEQYGVTDIRVFGSVARGEDTENSDIDLLINLKRKGLSDWCCFWADVRETLNHNVDVIPEKNLHWFIKPQILEEAKPL